MKILYVANVRMPTEKAHGLQIVKTCEAFADLHHSVELLVPRRRNAITDDPFRYYEARSNFSIRYIWCLDLVRWGKIGFLVQYMTFSIMVAFARKIRSADVLYGRDELTLMIASFFSRVPIIWESHVGAWNIAARYITKHSRIIIVISQGLKNFYADRGVDADRIVIAHDGIDLAQFAEPISQEAARSRLGLPLDKKIVMYIGRLDGWKGADTFCAAGERMETGALAVVIGGESDQVAVFKRRYPRVVFLGFRPYRELANNQSAADVLVLPNTSSDVISSHYTSPLKLFSYMTSGRPIIASDLPSIREVLSEESAVFVRPDNPESLADAITTLLADPACSTRLAGQAQIDVRDYTWRHRAERILASMVNEVSR